MTAVAYHARDRVDDTVVAAAEDAAGGECMHVAAADAAWEAATARAGALPSSRSPAVRRFCMQVVDELAALAHRLPGGTALDQHGLDLAEIARYDWYGRLGPAVQRAVAVRELMTLGADTVIWTGPAGDPAVLAGVLAARGIGLRHVPGLLGSPDEPSAPRRSPAQLVRLLAPPTRLPGRPGAVLFAEHFERGATIAAHVAATLDPADVLFVTTSEAARRAVDARLTVVPLTRLAGRRARLASLCPRHDLDALAHAMAEAVAGEPLGSLGDLTPLVVDGLASRTVAAWRTAATFAALWLDAMGRARPAVIAATTNAPSAVRAAAAVGRLLLSTPVCFVQHGVLTLHNEAYLDHDRYLVWGERDRRTLVELGVPADRIVVTGSPELDRLAEHPTQLASGGEVRVLYLPSRTGGRFVPVAQAKVMLDAVHAAVRTMDGAELTVKVHPSDRSDLFDGLDGVRIVRTGHVLTHLAGADVVVVSTSTAGFEACALDRPVVVLAPEGIDPLPEYEAYGAASVVTDVRPATVGAALVSLLAPGPVADQLAAGRRRLVTEIFGGARPGAAARIAAELRALAQPR